MEFHLGQKLWWVPSRGGFIRQGLYFTPDIKDSEVEVIKIGRRWIDLSNHQRIDRETLQADGKGYASPGRCYASEAAHHQEQEMFRLWDAFRNGVSRQYRPPTSLTLEGLKRAMGLLGFPVETDGDEFPL
jgi:hypothetical protein